ncbi:hypothetical protein J6590_025050, partial [Homalodisca vitripennis]
MSQSEPVKVVCAAAAAASTSRGPPAACKQRRRGHHTRPDPMADWPCSRSRGRHPRVTGLFTTRPYPDVQQILHDFCTHWRSSLHSILM